jgi:serine/threonine protein kinase
MIIEAPVHYQFAVERDKHGFCQPLILGQGKFAKVFDARQLSSERGDRRVAIKILHDYADHAQERMFDQEIKLLKDIGVASGESVVRALDILHLGPMIMCGCGKIYQPACPKGHMKGLVRKQPSPHDVFPALKCVEVGCDYEFSAQFVVPRYKELCSYPAKRCCGVGSSTQEVGTILNFVDRKAIVMEYFDRPLDSFVAHRRQELETIHDDRRSLPPKRPALFARWMPEWVAKWWASLGMSDEGEVQLRKTMLLEKIRLMVELIGAVERLHARGIVHKDLAPDNVMVKRVAEPGADDTMVIQGQRGRPRDAIAEMIFYPKHQVRVIDFGLSDKGNGTRSWYEEERGAVSLAKRPFWSPEALEHRSLIGMRIDIEFLGTDSATGAPCGRFKVPSTLRILPTDIIADQRSQQHDNDMEITHIVEERGRRFAYFRGVPPIDLTNQQFELVPRLGEPHDLFALGALFYFILTESINEVDHLAGFVANLAQMPNALNRAVLLEDKYYLQRRDAIVHKFWQDELMSLILRAMVRGQPESFVQSRIEAGQGPVQRLLNDTKGIYFGLHREIVKAI